MGRFLVIVQELLHAFLLEEFRRDLRKCFLYSQMKLGVKW